MRLPYLLFLGDVADQLAAKTAAGVAYWRPDVCVGQLRLPGCKADLGLADTSIEEALERGARTLLVGVANAGGKLPAHWSAAIVSAIDAGMDIASGLHTRLADVAELKAAAEAAGVALHDVRHPRGHLDVGTGVRRGGKRLLTVGSDCSVGKMYTSLALEREMRARGMKADFRATGQTGIFIAGSGISVDAVVADFISGAAEAVSPANDDDHWDLVEGQGSLFHPSYAGVSLGLLHGAQPDALVLCHEPTRTHMRARPDSPIPDLGVCLAANLEAARLTNPRVRAVGVAVNTSALTPEAAADLLAGISSRLQLPAVDPVRDGVAPIVDRLLQTDAA